MIGPHCHIGIHQRGVGILRVLPYIISHKPEGPLDAGAVGSAAFKKLLHSLLAGKIWIRRVELMCARHKLIVSGIIMVLITQGLHEYIIGFTFVGI